MKFNDLEKAALGSIAENYPELLSPLLTLFESCIVTKRENTGGGFFTHFEVGVQTLMPVPLRTPLGDAWISVENMVYGLCCLVHMTNGVPNLLEGYAVGGDDTSKIDFSNANFNIAFGPP